MLTAPAEEEHVKAEEEQGVAEEQRQATEAEAQRSMEDLQKAELQRRAEEEQERRLKAEKANGDVFLRYSHYNMQFPIKDGMMTAAEIDEVYCLSDVMPKCKIHLSTKSNEEKYSLESQDEVCPYIFEEPVGTFKGLEAGETYYVYVTEDEEEFLKSQEHAKRAFAGVKSEALRSEGCSCLEGNPCVDEYVCTDWHNRFALAKKHGWLGYQAK